MLHTTLRLLHEYGDYQTGYDPLINALPPDDRVNLDKLIPLSFVVSSAGLPFALQYLRNVVPGEEAARDRIARLSACDFAERVLPAFESAHPGCGTPRRAIATGRAFAIGDATSEELAAANSATYAVVDRTVNPGEPTYYAAYAAAYAAASATYVHAHATAYAAAAAAADPAVKGSKAVAIDQVKIFLRWLDT